MNAKKYWEYGPLRVSGDHRHLVNGDRPFFWLGDTAWLLFQTATEDEARMYLKNRADKGFTVIQAILIHNTTKVAVSSLTGNDTDAASEAYLEYSPSPGLRKTMIGC